MDTAKQPNPLPFDLLVQAVNDEEKAREIIEASRWPDGPVCPHCASKEVTRLKCRPTSVHLSAKHMHRYLSEFDFRWNRRKVSDGERVLATLRSLAGDRLYYRAPAGGQSAF